MKHILVSCGCDHSPERKTLQERLWATILSDRGFLNPGEDSQCVSLPGQQSFGGGDRRRELHQALFQYFFSLSGISIERSPKVSIRADVVDRLQQISMRYVLVGSKRIFQR